VGGASSLGSWKGPFLGFLILTGVTDARLQWAALVRLALGKGRSWGFLILTGVADARLQWAALVLLALGKGRSLASSFSPGSQTPGYSGVTFHFHLFTYPFPLPSFVKRG